MMVPTARVALITLIVSAAPGVALAQPSYTSINTARAAELSLYGGTAVGSYSFARVSSSP